MLLECLLLAKKPTVPLEMRCVRLLVITLLLQYSSYQTSTYFICISRRQHIILWITVSVVQPKIYFSAFNDGTDGIAHTCEDWDAVSIFYWYFFLQSNCAQAVLCLNALQALLCNETNVLSSRKTEIRELLTIGQCKISLSSSQYLHSREK